ncbi:MAG: hypothetical protein MUF02_07330 [Acidobacteria bacterium]|nr:hypothetical protein [Acidobacteriota bacterium]
MMFVFSQRSISAKIERSESGYRVGRLAAGADADGIDLDVEIAGHLGRVARIDLAAVVHPVGEQDDDLGLGRRVADAVDRGGQGHADGRTILQLAELGLLEIEFQDVVIHGQRTLGEGGGGEDDQAQAVAAAFLDEGGDDLLGHLQAVLGLEIDGGHRARDVQGEEDVHPLLLVDTESEEALRPGQGQDEQEQGGQLQRRQQAQQR